MTIKKILNTIRQSINNNEWEWDCSYDILKGVHSSGIKIMLREYNLCFLKIFPIEGDALEIKLNWWNPLFWKLKNIKNALDQKTANNLKKVEEQRYKQILDVLESK